MELREARESDYQAIIRLIKDRAELFRVYPKGEYPLTEEQLGTLAKVRSDLTVATEKGTVAGFANLYNLEPGHSAFIGNVIIDRSLRGKGLGKALVSHMIDLALKKYSLREVRISVFSDNTPALLLYTRMGFSPEAIEERQDWTGQRVALLHMVLRRHEWKGAVTAKG